MPPEKAVAVPAAAAALSTKTTAGSPRNPPKLNTTGRLPNVYFARVVDKIGAKGRRTRRVVLATSKALVFTEADRFYAKRVVPLSGITKLYVQDAPKSSRVSGGSGGGQALLVRVPDEYDVLIACPKSFERGFARRGELEELANIIVAIEAERGRTIEVVKVKPSESLYKEAFLIKLGKGAPCPAANFEQLRSLLSGHTPVQFKSRTATDGSAEEGSGGADAGDAKSKRGKDGDAKKGVGGDKTGAGGADRASVGNVSPFVFPGNGGGSGGGPSMSMSFADYSSPLGLGDTDALAFEERLDMALTSIFGTHCEHARETAKEKSSFGTVPITSPGGLDPTAPSPAVGGGSGSNEPLSPHADTVHHGEWRGDGKQLYCSRDGELEGVRCAHPPPIIKAFHWSCCGATEYAAPTCSYNGVLKTTTRPLCEICTKVLPERPAAPTDACTCPGCGARACDLCMNDAFKLRIMGSSTAPARVCKICFAEAGLGHARPADVEIGSRCQVCIKPLGRRAAVGGAGDGDEHVPSKVCRRCGAIVCDTCGGFWMRFVGGGKPARVCVHCFHEGAELQTALEPVAESRRLIHDARARAAPNAAPTRFRDMRAPPGHDNTPCTAPGGSPRTRGLDYVADTSSPRPDSMKIAPGYDDGDSFSLGGGRRRHARSSSARRRSDFRQGGGRRRRGSDDAGDARDLRRRSSSRSLLVAGGGSGRGSGHHAHRHTPQTLTSPGGESPYAARGGADGLHDFSLSPPAMNRVGGRIGAGTATADPDDDHDGVSEESDRYVRVGESGGTRRRAADPRAYRFVVPYEYFYKRVTRAVVAGVLACVGAVASEKRIRYLLRRQAKKEKRQQERAYQVYLEGIVRGGHLAPLHPPHTPGGLGAGGLLVPGGPITPDGCSLVAHSPGAVGAGGLSITPGGAVSAASPPEVPPPHGPPLAPQGGVAAASPAADAGGDGAPTSSDFWQGFMAEWDAVSRGDALGTPGVASPPPADNRNTASTAANATTKPAGVSAVVRPASSAAVMGRDFLSLL